jgi:predicted Zn-ribbon and HTH transcriptional regulator
MDTNPFDVLRRLLLWTVVCGISAAPSFYWAMADQFDVLAMVTGVVVFIFALTALTSTRRFMRFRDRPFVRRTLYIGYGLRVLVSLIFPAGLMLDMVPGLFSISAVQALGVPEKSYVGTLMITLVQGSILNAILSVLMMLMWGAQRLVFRVPASPEHACTKCGYDLRGSTRSARCPECGAAHEPIRAAIRAGSTADAA